MTGSRQRHGPRLLLLQVPRQLLLLLPLLLLLNGGVLAQDGKKWVWSKANLKDKYSDKGSPLLIYTTATTLPPQTTTQGPQRRQDFNTNFGGPPLGDNGFVGENLIPRPQGLVDLGSFGDKQSPSDIFHEVDQTFNFANQLTHESETFQPSLPRTELSNDISSFSTINDVRETSLADDGFPENTAFKVFHGPETETAVDAGSDNLFAPEDVLTVNFEENQQPFPPPGVRGNRRPACPGHPNCRPLRRRPIRQPFPGRHRAANKPRRTTQSSILSFLSG